MHCYVRKSRFYSNDLIVVIFLLFLREQGYKQEFNKIQANHTTRIEREELLRGSDVSSSSGLSRRDMYLKESTHLNRCEIHYHHYTARRKGVQRVAILSISWPPGEN